MLPNNCSIKLVSYLPKRIALCITIICFLLSVYASLLSAQEKASGVTSYVTTSYDLTSDGDDIGDVSIIRTQHGDAGNSIYLIEEKTSIKVSSFFGSWEMTSTGKIVLKNEELVGFDYKIEENTNHWHVFGDRHNQELWCGYLQLSATKKKNEEAEKIQMPLDSFDATSSQLVSFLLRRHKGIKKEKVNVLNTSELKIETLTLEEVDQEQIEIAGKTFKCRVFKAISPNKKITYWVAEDDLGAFLVKEFGKDDDGPYEIILKQYLKQYKND